MFTARYGLIPYTKQITFRLIRGPPTFVATAGFLQVSTYPHAHINVILIIIIIIFYLAPTKYAV